MSEVIGWNILYLGLCQCRKDYCYQDQHCAADVNECIDADCNNAAEVKTKICIDVDCNDDPLPTCIS